MPPIHPPPQTMPMLPTACTLHRLGPAKSQRMVSVTNFDPAIVCSRGRCQRKAHRPAPGENQPLKLFFKQDISVKTGDLTGIASPTPAGKPPPRCSLQQGQRLKLTRAKGEPDQHPLFSGWESEQYGEAN
ncbi:hypothetical protein KIL84_008873 [Mauremys mutica]|uniref:Uncharacterized protein n=1 Tax=Mauremys mutica TaxID=74926 RepID=A0A9D4AST7_9SAUR|nr:hypothetical protein KIL84_008873 [Mauremys mutica]